MDFGQKIRLFMSYALKAANAGKSQGTWNLYKCIFLFFGDSFIDVTPISLSIRYLNYSRSWAMHSLSCSKYTVIFVYT